MTILPMQTGHYDALVSLWQSFAGNTMTGADSKEGFEEFLKRNGAFCFTAIENGTIAGSVMAGEDSRRGYVYHLSVREDLHKLGIGKALMENAETALYSAGIEKIHLFIYSDNPAIDFYRKTGWHLRDDIEVMSKVLRGNEYLGTRGKPVSE
jgi:ribosomal protein S18 acetylase RimI-like enzyme